MKIRLRHPISLSFLLGGALLLMPQAGAQASPQNNTQQSDNDTTRREVASFDQFLDSHPEISEQIRKDPSLVNNEEFVEKHPALHDYLQDHPRVREEVKENPNAFMHRERRYERSEADRDRDRDRDKDRDRDRGIAVVATATPPAENLPVSIDSWIAIQKFPSRFEKILPS
jgi:hypothetical protein